MANLDHYDNTTMDRSESNSSLSSRSLSEFVDDVNTDSMPEVSITSTPRGVKSASSGSRIKSAVSMRSTPSRPASGISMTKPATKTQRKPLGSLKRKDKRKESWDHSIDDDEDKKEPEIIHPEEKLSACLEICLADCSRQRLRAFHMSLRHLGTVDNRVSSKDMQTALQDNQIKLPERCWLMVVEIFEDENGIDYEKLCVCLSTAHLKTGRDSIKARSKRNDVEAREVFRQEDVDQDFMRRLEELLIHDHTFYDIERLRTEFSNWDLNRVGKVDKEGAMLICEDKTPLYGALLKNILNRCDEDKDKKVSWPLLLNFMERSQASAWEKVPELSTLPEKAKENASRSLMTPDPIDELSSSARNAVSRLLKKAQKRRGNSADSSPDPPFGRLSPGQPTAVTSEKSSTNQNQPSNEGSNTVSKDAKSITKDSNTLTDDDNNSQTNSKRNGTEHNAVKEKEQDNASDERHKKEDLRRKRDRDQHIRQIPGSDAEVVVPPGFKSNCDSQEPPQERMTLEWIYGYRGNDCNNKLQLVGDGEIIYFIGAVVVLYSLEDEAQRHYREHNENIRCLCVHSNGLIVASGQFASKTRQYDQDGNQASLHIWRSDTLQTLHVLGEGVFHKAVSGLAFMPGEINTATLCDIQFNPRYPETLVTAGREHLEWWRVNKEAGVVQPSALPKYEARYIHTVAHTKQGDLMTGDSNGTVYVWGDGGNSITNYIKHGHDGPVYSLLYNKGTLLTGGRDGFLKMWEWSKNMDQVTHLQLSQTDGGIRTILIHPTLVGEGNSPAVILGTTMNGLFLGHTDMEDSKDLVSVTQGHTDDVRGLGTISQSAIGSDIITVSRDGILCQLNTGKKDVVWRMVLKGYSFTCVDASPCGQRLVMGTKDGRLIILHVSQEDGAVLEILNRKLTSSLITCAKASPDFRLLAVGGMDKTLYIFRLRRKERKENKEEEEEDDDEQERWVLQGKCKGHLAPITSLDWSRNTKDDVFILRSSSSHPDQLFWNPMTCTQLLGPDVCDVTWYSYSCTLDHAVIGLWSSKQMKGNNVACIDVHPSKHLVAMATDNNGVISLFRYPSYSDGAFSHVFKAHGQTRQIRFTPDGRGLITVGGADLSIMQWKLT